MNSISHHTHIKTTLVVLVAFAALALPASALAAGTVGTDAGGNVTYYGDGEANVLNVTASPTSGTAATLVFSETGITEGTDTAGICTPSANTVTCNYSLFDNLKLYGDDGADQLTLNGPVGSSIEGEAGADVLRGGDAYDSLLGGDGSDTLDGRGATDLVDGGSGPDVVRGAEGNDYSYYDAGNNDDIDLGPGRDHFFTQNNDGTGDRLQGGAGADLISFSTVGASGDEPFTTVDLSKGTLSFGAFGGYDAGTDSLSGIEDAGEFYGQSGDDVLIGSAESNLLAGGNGNDTLVGGAGTDTLAGDGALVGIDHMFELPNGGADTIDAYDGFEDRVQCGSGADSVVSDQFDASLMVACENVDLRQADPFGISPAMPGSGEPKAEPDVRAPACTSSRLATVKRSTFVRRGFSFTLRCDEQARVETTASVGVKRARRGGVVVSGAGDLVLGEKTLSTVTSGRKVTFKVPRPLRPALGRRFTVRIRIDATDRAGNRSSAFARLKVR